jgi:hypothetical protein
MRARTKYLESGEHRKQILMGMRARTKYLESGECK